MKKYISPIAKTIMLNAEAVLLDNSPAPEKVDPHTGNFADNQYDPLSNRKRWSIWDE